MLSKLFFGEISPFTTRYLQNNKYTQAMAKLTQTEEQVQNLIGNEHLAALESLAKANGKVAEILALLAFQEGFCLAMSIALDVHKHLHPPQSEQAEI